MEEDERDRDLPPQRVGDRSVLLPSRALAEVTFVMLKAKDAYPT